MSQHDDDDTFVVFEDELEDLPHAAISTIQCSGVLSLLSSTVFVFHLSSPDEG